MSELQAPGQGAARWPCGQASDLVWKTQRLNDIILSGMSAGHCHHRQSDVVISLMFSATNTLDIKVTSSIQCKFQVFPWERQ